MEYIDSSFLNPETKSFGEYAVLMFLLWLSRSAGATITVQIVFLKP